MSLFINLLSGVTLQGVIYERRRTFYKSRSTRPACHVICCSGQQWSK